MDENIASTGFFAGYGPSGVTETLLMLVIIFLCAAGAGLFLRKYYRFVIPFMVGIAVTIAFLGVSGHLNSTLGEGTIDLLGKAPTVSTRVFASAPPSDIALWVFLGALAFASGFWFGFHETSERSERKTDGSPVRSTTH